jgi:hypothetical protein
MGSFFRDGRYYVRAKSVYLRLHAVTMGAERRANKGLQSLFPTARQAIQDGSHE